MDAGRAGLVPAIPRGRMTRRARRGPLLGRGPSLAGLFKSGRQGLARWGPAFFSGLSAPNPVPLRTSAVARRLGLTARCRRRRRRGRGAGQLAAAAHRHRRTAGRRGARERRSRARGDRRGRSPLSRAARHREPGARGSAQDRRGPRSRDRRRRACRERRDRAELRRAHGLRRRARSRRTPPPVARRARARARRARTRLRAARSRPRASAPEAALAPDLDVRAAPDLGAVLRHLLGASRCRARERDSGCAARAHVLDLADVRGQETRQARARDRGRRRSRAAAARRARLRQDDARGAAAGPAAGSRLRGGARGHAHPRRGRTLLRGALAPERPFRAPHHTASAAGLLGGGNPPRPGEVSLAHRGVLFLDELPEFERRALESLRQVLEERRVVVARAGATCVFPAEFQLVAAMNPCPCGWRGAPRRDCRCDDAAVARYAARISGPLLDRIDLHVSVLPVAWHELEAPAVRRAPTTATRARVAAARARQRARGTPPNARLRDAELDAAARATPEATRAARPRLRAARPVGARGAPRAARRAHDRRSRGRGSRRSAGDGRGARLPGGCAGGLSAASRPHRIECGPKIDTAWPILVTEGRQSFRTQGEAGRQLYR